jgi:hypothetical protein
VKAYEIFHEKISQKVANGTGRVFNVISSLEKNLSTSFPRTARLAITVK